MLDKIAARTPAETDRYVIQIKQKTVEKLLNKNISITLNDKEAMHEVPENAIDIEIYEFEVNFADEETDYDND